MKPSIILFIFILLHAGTVSAQGGEELYSEPPPVKIKEEVQEKQEEPILEFVEQEAEFIGGTTALMEWIKANLQYPKEAIERHEQGRVYVAFVVEKDGSITNVRVERGVADLLDAEAKRVVGAMPKWKPGMNGGKAIRHRCRLPINFKLP